MLKHVLINNNSASNRYYSQSLGHKYRQKFGMHVSGRSRFTREKSREHNLARFKLLTELLLRFRVSRDMTLCR